jgi:hypothetical protein
VALGAKPVGISHGAQLIFILGYFFFVPFMENKGWFSSRDRGSGFAPRFCVCYHICLVIVIRRRRDCRLSPD